MDDKRVTRAYINTQATASFARNQNRHPMFAFAPTVAASPDRRHAQRAAVRARHAAVIATRRATVG